MQHSRTLLLWSVLFALLLTAPLAAQQMPADSVLRDFEPNDDFGLYFDDEPVAHSEIFHSKRAAAYLIMAPALDTPLLVNIRSTAVESVHLMKVARRPDGTVDLLADAVTEMVSGFTLKGRDVVFQLGDKTAKLKEKQPLTGNASGQDLKNYSASYVFKSKSYTPTEASMAALQKQGAQVLVKTYFGTWCPVCSRLLPNVLKVEDELEGSNVQFEYYGLPKDMRSDPESQKAEITGVPTTLVFVNGKEVGRLKGNDLHKPEVTLQRMLGAN